MTAGPRRTLFDRRRFARRMVRPVERFQVRRWGRTVLVAAHAEPDGNLLVVAGAGGQARTPGWVA